MIENELRRHYVAAMTKARLDARLYIRNVGKFELSTGGRFHAGVAGQADVWGWVRTRKNGFDRPVPVEIELKNLRTPHSDAQKNWAECCATWGVPFLLLRAERLETPDGTIERWVRETEVFFDEL